MAKCDCCGKGVSFGIQVSHSHRRSNRTWKPNVKRVKAIVDGSPKYIYACTRCLRSGKVILFGVVVAYAAGVIMDMTVVPSMGAILLAFSVSVGIGMIFGYFPANKAAKLNPIDALRYD